MNQPPPTQTNSTHRHLLLPYLALGFAPTHTSGANYECGLRALLRAYRDARDALRPPGAPVPRHATLTDFRNLLDSEVYRNIVTEQLINYGIYGLDEDDPVRQENIANAWRKIDLDITNLVQLLEAANRQVTTMSPNLVNDPQVSFIANNRLNTNVLFFVEHTGRILN
jgi:hypothetical protein